jgi:hypothetical protein
MTANDLIQVRVQEFLTEAAANQASPSTGSSTSRPKIASVTSGGTTPGTFRRFRTSLGLRQPHGFGATRGAGAGLLVSA